MLIGNYINQRHFGVFVNTVLRKVNPVNVLVVPAMLYRVMFLLLLWFWNEISGFLVSWESRTAYFYIRITKSHIKGFHAYDDGFRMNQII